MCLSQHSHPGWDRLSFGQIVKVHKTSLSQNGTVYDRCHLCNTNATVIGLALVSFSDELHFIKANENSHYMCSEVSLTYGNTLISYGFNLPCMWIFTEDFLSCF